MKRLMIAFVLLLVGCAARQPFEPVFTDAEKNARAEQFDDWYRNAAKGR